MFRQPVLVAIDTGRGVVYAPASGWDQIYLLWIFRNFRSLPQTVLNQRQQRLIGSLYRDACSYSAHKIYEGEVIGTIEGFNPSSLSALLVPPEIEKQSADTRIFDHSRPRYLRFSVKRLTLRVGAGALAVILAVLAWHQLKAESISRAESDPTVAAAQSSVEPGMIADRFGPATAPASPVSALAFSQAIGGMKAIASPSALVTEVAGNDREGMPLGMGSKPDMKGRMVSVHHPVAASAGEFETSADRLRMRISGSPRKLVYPVCPETQARGTVSLKAVVGFDGAVNQVRVVTGDRTLAAAAVAAVRQWRYEPFSDSAQSQEREASITVSFISNQVVSVSFPDSASVSR
ncbi:MAG: energy transducer TonB [Terriglobales bacterium]